MAIDRNFYDFASGYTAGSLAKVLRVPLIGGATPDVEITDILPFDRVVAHSLSFQSDLELAKLASVKGAVLIVSEDIANVMTPLNSCLVSKNPRITFAHALDQLVKPVLSTRSGQSVAPDVEIADGASIHPTAVIKSGARIGQNTVIDAGVVINEGVSIGADCYIGANAVLSFAILEDSVRIGAGTVIGEAGFGFEMTADGAVKIPHIGRVRIGQAVSIGASCAIDRGSLGDTVVAAHVMIDNLCHIAHNVTIGSNSVIAGQAGISGSVTIGANVMMGGQVGIAPHVTIGDGATLTARSGVTKDVDATEQVAGFPAMPARQFWREQAALRRLIKPRSKP